MQHSCNYICKQLRIILRNSPRMPELPIFFYAITAGIFICLISLSGAIYRFVRPSNLRILLPYTISLSVGILLGHAFIHLIPEAVEAIGSIYTVSLWTMGGMVLFFFMEKAMARGRSVEVVADAHPAAPIKRIGKMSLLGDFIHNFTDGTLIAGSFLVSPELGVATTLAVAAHEIPQEITDAGALIYSGHSLRRSLLFNFITSLSCIIGIFFVMVIKTSMNLPVEYILPVAAGGFIYVAARDMMPELQDKPFSLKAHVGQSAAILIGLMLMMLTAHAHHIHE